MMLHKFNANQDIRVKLTPVGKQMFREQYAKDCEECSALSKTWDPVPEEDEHGYSKWQFHHLISTFGSKLFCVGNTNYSAIETNMLFEIGEEL